MIMSKDYKYSRKKASKKLGKLIIDLIAIDVYSTSPDELIVKLTDLLDTAYKLEDKLLDINHKAEVE
jgi:hypothetical protein